MMVGTLIVVLIASFMILACELIGILYGSLAALFFALMGIVAIISYIVVSIHRKVYI